ncbi:MAG: alpha-D-ribose 1-methylphosphonate 5-triphosphate synthase subunit PhnH [Solirubrobacteraceae bacterium]
MSAATPTIAAHEAFRALLLALAHPGRPFAHGAGADVTAVLAAVYEPDTAAWQSAGWPRSFGRPSPVEAAHLLLIAGDASHGALLAANRGSEERPESAATAAYLVAGERPATAVTLRGPGVDGALATELRLTSGELADRDRACASFPLGIDLVLLGDGFVTGLPRTTQVEVRG